jgi:acetyl-CoA carboxylase biotin carboxyl carrier protein
MARRELRSEVTGLVWKLQVRVGQRFGAGETLLLMESMKMEIPLISEDAGTIVELLVGEGDAVQEGQVIAVIEV